MEFAVNMPAQDPQVGQALRSKVEPVLGGGLRIVSATAMVSTASILSSAPAQVTLPASIGAAGDEHAGNVEAQRGHQHAGRDLVAVGDADHGVGAVRVHHVLDAVGDQVARRQRVEHAVVAHRDAVVHRDGVELTGNAAGPADLLAHQPAEIAQVDVAGHELHEGIHHRDDRLAEVLVGEARSAPQRPRADGEGSFGRGAGAVTGHGGILGRRPRDCRAIARIARRPTMPVTSDPTDATT